MVPTNSFPRLFAFLCPALLGIAAVTAVAADAPVYYFSTFAGAASIGSADGPGAVARFSTPEGITVDRAGNVYVMDAGNGTIRQISPAGMVSTLAGKAGEYGSADGTGADARFGWFNGNRDDLVADAAGNLYLADSGNHVIRKITPAGVVTTLAGTVGLQGFDDGVGAAAQFSDFYDLTIDGAGNLYTIGYDSIRRITPTGVVTTVVRNSGYGYGLAIDPAGNFFQTTYAGLDRITPGGAVTLFAGLTDYASGFADGVGTAAQFSLPSGIVADPAGNLFIADRANAAIRQVTPTAAVTTIAGIPGTTGAADGPAAKATFAWPDRITRDSAGNLYVVDTNAVRKITPGGTVSTVAGMPASLSAGSTDGRGTAARFHQPRAIAVTPGGVCFVADNYSHIIRKISPAGDVSTFAGAAGQRGLVDGLAADARFDRKCLRPRFEPAGAQDHSRGCRVNPARTGGQSRRPAELGGRVHGPDWKNVHRSRGQRRHFSWGLLGP